MTYDLAIRGGRIVDGTGNPSYHADIAVMDGSITKIGHINAEADREIDANGMVVCPGFIDPHNHSDVPLLLNPKFESMIHQGVTTMVLGQCGVSLAPLKPENKKYFHAIIPLYAPKWHIESIGWETFAEYLQKIDEVQISCNTAFLIGHATVRVAAMQFERRSPTKEELNRMKDMVEEAMRAGAFGFSSALALAPGAYAEAEELIELLKVVNQYDGAYFAHLRDEADRVIESLKETIHIGEEAGVPVQIAHLKALGKQNWGRASEILLQLQATNTRHEVYADQYPFRAASVYLAIVLPPWAQEGGIEKLMERLRNSEELVRIRQEIEKDTKGKWQNIIHGCGYEGILVTSVKTNQNKGIEGKSLAEIAEIREVDPFTATIELLLEEQADVVIVFFGMAEEDVQTIIKNPYVMIGSDGWALSPQGPLAGGVPHPRTYSTFPRVLRKYIREKNVLSLEEGIRKMTSFPAQRLRLQDRGLLREGMAGDIVIFDHETIQDNATFTKAHRFPSGISHVLVNGTQVIENGRHTGATPGKVLRNQD